MGKRSRNDEHSTGSSDEYSGTVSSPAKLVEIDLDEQIRPAKFVMQCSLPPHKPLEFETADDFDLHYTKEHTNRCSSCGKNFPTSHFLALHLDENHNPVREALAAKGEKTYACFIQDCDRKCSTPQKRRLHLIDKHMFPKQYRFGIVDTGIDRASSMLKDGRRRRLSSATASANSHARRTTFTPHLSHVSQTPASGAPSETLRESAQHRQSPRGLDPDVQSLARSMSTLQFVPPSVRAKQKSKKSE